MRFGIGYDVHRLVHGRRLILGGVEIPFEQGLEGHSDADVLLHALMDAMLGAVALGDIGQYFPPGDPRFKDADSVSLLVATAQLLNERGYLVSNLDATIVAEAPRVMPFVLEMRERIARALRLELDQVSVKATTTEGLGFAGRGEGIAAYAIAGIELLEKAEKLD